jgi:hypothetical protein
VIESMPGTIKDPRSVEEDAAKQKMARPINASV